MAFAVYGFAVVMAPLLGPTVDGWITENYSWRWIFFINIPIAILSLILTHKLIEDSQRIHIALVWTRSSPCRMWTLP